MRIARGFCWISALALFFGFTTAAMPAGRTPTQVAVSVSFGPPELPVYEQPLCPGDGYIWTPGYWAWDPDAGDYFWVPGTWVLPPQPGYLWTPGYWAWNGTAFAFYEGYWGPVVGFYGGINYGFGYFGHGYEGGRWEHNNFYYNRSVNNVNITQIHNVYNTTIVHNNPTRVSYNGGNGGISARATSEELAAARERHVGPVSQQMQHVEAARADQSLRASHNHGKPPIAATPRPAALSEHGVVAAREAGKYNPPPGGNGNHGSPSRASNRLNEASPAPKAVIHPNDAPPHPNLPAPNTGNPKLDQKYQQQQEKLRAKQEQEHQKLQQKQDQEHQKLMKQQADEARKQQMEQRHQQQTQQMEQKHAQQLQKLQRHQQQPAPHPNPGKPPHS